MRGLGHQGAGSAPELTDCLLPLAIDLLFLEALQQAFEVL